MTAGLGVAAALDGQHEPIASYAARLEEIRRIYVMRLRSIYRSERRLAQRIVLVDIPELVIRVSRILGLLAADLEAKSSESR